MRKLLLSLSFLLFVTILSAQVIECFEECFYEPESICFDLFDPVCGCDEVEYSNECFALASGIPSWSEGACSNECDISVSFSASFEGAIGTDDEPQSYLANEYCFWVTSSNIINDATFNWDFGNGNTSTEASPCELFPVILDGVPQTMDYHVVLRVTDGDCVYVYNMKITEEEEEETCVDLTDVDFGECEMALGIGLVNQSCAFISGCSMFGSDGVDYSDSFYESIEDCDAACGSCPDLSGVDFGVCAMVLGIGVVDNNCVFISGCSFFGSDGVDYTNSFYETIEECDEACGSCIDQSIIDLDAICPTVAIPVCGCDGVTYNNGCDAENFYGVTSYTNGPCQIDPCTDLSGIDFGECEMLLGVGIVDGLCSYISGCGPSDSFGTNYSGAIFSSMEECTQCDQSECINPAQINPDGVCTFEYAPVCGCDDVTYSNSCFAVHSGVTSWVVGECLVDNVSDIETRLNQIRVFPNPSSEMIYVELESEKIETVVLLNQLSQQVYISNNQKNNSSSLDVSLLPRGIYYLKIQSETGKMYTSKIEVAD